MKRRGPRAEHTGYTGAEDHPSACHVRRFPSDDLLRSNGFIIHARKNNAEAIWRGPDGDLYTQSAALVLIQEIQETAEAA